MEAEPSVIANRDWRLQAVTTLAKEFVSPRTGQRHPAGAPVSATAFATREGRLLQFALPNPAAMYISMAHRALAEATQSLDHVFSLPFTKADGPAQLPSAEEPLFLDALEQFAASLVFSYSSIEAFANSSIPDTFTFQRLRDDRRCTETYTKDQIERNINLETKLHEILPSIHKVKSPKGTKIWQDFIWLKELRDRLVHLKSEDWRGSVPDNAAALLWSSLLHEKVRQAPKIAVAVLGHYQPKKPPRWLQKLPFPK